MRILLGHGKAQLYGEQAFFNGPNGLLPAGRNSMLNKTDQRMIHMWQNQQEEAIAVRKIREVDE